MFSRHIFYIIFEFDTAKSEANLVKHGIDFVAAQALWHDPNVLEISARDVDDEPRLLMIRLGVTRQSIIKVWLSERLERAADTRRR